LRTNTDADTYSDSHGKPNGDAHTDGDANSDGFAIGHADGDAYTDGNAHADSGNADGDAYVPAWGHTWAVGYRRARATHPLPRRWHHGRHLRLRLRRLQRFRAVP
jgi:hypothetical protein